MKKPICHHNIIIGRVIRMLIVAIFTSVIASAAIPPSVIAAVTTEDVLNNRHIAGTWLPSGIPGSDENKALLVCLTEVSNQDYQAWATGLNSFAKTHPASSWNIAIQFNLGEVAYRDGYFSRAIEHWKTCWDLGAGISGQPMRSFVDRAGVLLIQLYAKLGRMEDVRRLMPELDNRPVTGSSRSLLDGAKSALIMMENDPGHSFLCGPYALQFLCTSLNRGLDVSEIQNVRSTTNGTQMAQLAELAEQINFPVIIIRRDTGAPVPCPSVVHWRSGHFAAVTESYAGQFHVEDPTFIDNFMVSQMAIDDESSGYFIIPKQRMQPGWHRVDVKEAALVSGKGITTAADINETKKTSIQAGGTLCDKGMATYSVHAMLVSLRVTDTPIGYKPPFGPAINFTVAYNEREANQPPILNFSNLGPLWSHDFLSLIDYDATSAKVIESGGGAVTYKFNTSSQTYNHNFYSFAMLDLQTTGAVRYYSRKWPDGTVQTFHYQSGLSRYFLDSITDEAGNTIRLLYDDYRRLTNIVDAAGQTTTLNYDPSITSQSDYAYYRIAGITDPFGRQAHFYYAASGMLTSIVDTVGITSSFEYDQNFRMTAMTTPYGRYTFTRFVSSSSLNRWIEARDPYQGVERVEFNQSNIPPLCDIVPGVDANISTVNYRYRNTYFWDKKAYANGGAVYDNAHIYHWLHKLPKLSGTTAGSLEWEKDPMEETFTWYGYPGQVSGDDYLYEGTSSYPSVIGRWTDVSTGRAPAIVKMTHNLLGNLTSFIDPSGRMVTNVYDSNQIDLTTVSQKNGAGIDQLAAITWNSQHRPLSITDAAGKITSFGYNSRGQLLAVTNPLSEVTSYNYTTNGYLTSIIEPLNTTNSFTYDAFGRIATVTGPDGYQLGYQYDGLDRLTNVLFPDGTFESMSYKYLDPHQIRDRAGRITTLLYDNIRQLSTIIDPENRITSLLWCKCGSPSQMIDPEGRITQWTYDIRGRLTQKLYPDSTAETYTYQPHSGLLQSVTDPNNQSKVYTWTREGFLQRIDYSNAVVATPSVSWYYDTVFPRMTSRVDGIGTTIYTYNPMNQQSGAGRLSSENGPFTSDTITYAYDALGRVQTQAVNGVESLYLYDALGRISSISNSLGVSSNIFDGSTPRLLEVRHAFGLTNRFNYLNVLGDKRLASLVHLSSGVISSNSYSYNVTGMITQWLQTATTTNYYSITYDRANQMNAWIEKASSGTVIGVNTYNYDRAGNRTGMQLDSWTVKSFVNRLNQITNRVPGGKVFVSGLVDEPASVQLDSQPVLVDTNGQFSGYRTLVNSTNLIAISAVDVSGNITNVSYKFVADLTGATNKYRYDANGNMTQYIFQNATNKYVWDAENRLVLASYSNDNERTEFLYDGLGRLTKTYEVFGGSTSSTSVLIWDGMTQVERRTGNVSTVIRRFLPQGMIIVSGSSNTGYYTTFDHLGSIRELVTTNGTVATRYGYSEWGTRTLLSGSIPSDYGFTGHRTHDRSGLVLAPFRAYNSSIGRWLSRDPIQENGGINLYQYAGNNPICFTDPLGLLIIPTIGQWQQFGSDLSGLWNKYINWADGNRQALAESHPNISKTLDLIEMGASMPQAGGFGGGGLGMFKCLKGLNIVDDLVLTGGRSGSNVKNLIGPANSVLKGSEGRIFITNDKGKVILDITKDRVKPVTPGQGFGPKRIPTKEELDLINKVHGGG